MISCARAREAPLGEAVAGSTGNRKQLVMEEARNLGLLYTVHNMDGGSNTNRCKQPFDNLFYGKKHLQLACGCLSFALARAITV